MEESTPGQYLLIALLALVLLVGTLVMFAPALISLLRSEGQ